MNTDGKGHGKRGEVPEGFSVADAEPLIGEVPSREKETRHYYFCLWCEELFKGERGYKIHLSGAQGDENHPESASVEDRHYTLVPTKRDGEPMLTAEEIKRRGSGMLNIKSRIGIGTQEPESARPSSPIKDPETIDIPDDLPKPEQVAAIITQEPSLFHDPEAVMDLVNCSRTTFYEGRNLYKVMRKYEAESEEV